MSVSSFLFPMLYTIFLWWFGTGIILLLNQRPRSTHQATFWMSGMVLLFALVGLKTSANLNTVAGAYCGFTCALLVWAWQEIGFLLGYVTGSRRTPCPPDCRGVRKAFYAFQTIFHHELALIVLGTAVVIATWGGSNLVGLWTFLILWAMRQSAKLNVFLGVLNLNEKFLPVHLQYMHSYFTKRAMNPLLPISILLACLVALPLWQHAFAANASAYQIASSTILATLLSLAILEHIMMVLPFSTDGLWKWGLRS
jgi:putative photosynthetic complex assembly protein 2